MWIPAAEKARARAVQNMVAAAEATASPEPIAVEKGRAKAVQNMVAAVVATASMAPIAVAAVEVTASMDPIAVEAMASLMPVVVAHSVDPEVLLMVPVVVARSVDPEVPLVEAVDAAVEVARPLSPTFSRRLIKPPFFWAQADESAIAVYVGLVQV